MYSKNYCKCNKKLLSGNQPLPHLKNTKLIKIIDVFQKLMS